MEDLCSTEKGDGFSRGLRNFQIMSLILPTYLDSLFFRKTLKILHHLMVISENTVKLLQVHSLSVAAHTSKVAQTSKLLQILQTQTDNRIQHFQYLRPLRFQPCHKLERMKTFPQLLTNTLWYFWPKPDLRIHMGTKQEPFKHDMLQTQFIWHYSKLFFFYVCTIGNSGK